MSMMGYTVEEITAMAEWPSRTLLKVFFCSQYESDQGRYFLTPMWEVEPHGKIIDRAEWWALRKHKVFGAPLDAPPTSQNLW